MKYLDTAFLQLELAMKLWNAVRDGRLDPIVFDRPITIIEGESLIVLQDGVQNSPQDLEVAFENLICIAFGAAVITLDRSRIEAGLDLPDPIDTEIDQFVALVYQIRNAFAHDIAEPTWKIKDRYRRTYAFEGVRADLGQVFDLL